MNKMKSGGFSIGGDGGFSLISRRAAHGSRGPLFWDQIGQPSVVDRLAEILRQTRGGWDRVGAGNHRVPTTLLVAPSSARGKSQCRPCPILSPVPTSERRPG